MPLSPPTPTVSGPKPGTSPFDLFLKHASQIRQVGIWC